MQEARHCLVAVTLCAGALIRASLGWFAWSAAAGVVRAVGQRHIQPPLGQAHPAALIQLDQPPLARGVGQRCDIRPRVVGRRSSQTPSSLITNTLLVCPASALATVRPMNWIIMLPLLASGMFPVW